MSLSEVVLEIVEEMEEDMSSPNTEKGIVDALAHYAKALKRAAKASEGASSSLHEVISGTNKRLLQESQQNLHECMSTIKQVEKHSSGMVELVGDPASSMPEFLPIEENIPVGATPIVNGSVYKMEQDGKLHYQEEATRQFRARLKKI